MSELAFSPVWLRISIFTVVVSLLLICEMKYPLFKLKSLYFHHKANLLLFIAGVVLTRITIPASLYAFESQSAWQLDFINLDHFLITYLILDLTLYWQHRWTHELSFLWKLHRVHHYDLAMTMSTGLRFHPVEILGSLGLKLTLCILLKLNPLGLLFFEILLNASSLFSHANIRIPNQFRKWLNFIIFTPYLHRIHHSQLPEEQRSNYGFILCIWDRLFKTYRSEQDLSKITLGVANSPQDKMQDIGYLLKSPFKD